jgi:hypothetical protein
MNLASKSAKRTILSSLIVASLLGTASISTALDIGDKAPDFTLPATTGEKISLSQFRDKKNVLVEFYVADFGAT